MVYKLSPRSLNLYVECNRCFFEYVKEGISRPSGPFPSLPSGIDSVLKKYFDSFRAKGRLCKELEKHKDLEGLTLFNDQELLKVWRTQRKGLTWQDTKGNTLSGTLDEVLVKDGLLIVMDYKTRGYPLKSTPDYYQLQLDCYNFLLRKNNHPTQDFSLLLFLYPKCVGNELKVEFETQIVKMPVNADVAENTFNQAIKLLDEKKPNSNSNCGFCKWKKMNGNL